MYEHAARTSKDSDDVGAKVGVLGKRLEFQIKTVNATVTPHMVLDPPRNSKNIKTRLSTTAMPDDKQTTHMRKVAP